MGHPDIHSLEGETQVSFANLGRPHRGLIPGTLELCLQLLIWNAPVAMLMFPPKLRRRFVRFVLVRRRGRFMFGMTFLR
jgi:hypothetical protein